MSTKPATTRELEEEQEDLRAAQAERQEELVVLGAQLDYAKRELAELELAVELAGADNDTAITDKEATIARIERNLRGKSAALAVEERSAQELRERHVAAQLLELEVAEQQILEAAPAASARIGAAAFGVLQAISAREALGRRLRYMQAMESDLRSRSGQGSGRDVRPYASPRYDMDAIVDAALGWARSMGREVDMDTWTLIEAGEEGTDRE